MDILLKINCPNRPEWDGRVPSNKKLQDDVEEALDKYFGPEEFDTDWYTHYSPPEARHAMAAAHSDIPGRFQELERWLYLLPKQVQTEFNQLVNNYSQALADAKRKIRQPWRR